MFICQGAPAQPFSRLITAPISTLKNAKVWRMKVRNVDRNPAADYHRIMFLAGKKWTIRVSCERSDVGTTVSFTITPKRKLDKSKFFLGQTRMFLINQKEQESNYQKDSPFFVNYGSTFSRFYEDFDTEPTKENGFLNDSRALEVEIHVFVDRILDVNVKFSHFNFHDSFNDDQYFQFYSWKTSEHDLYSKSQMLHFHSPVISELIKGGFKKLPIVKESQFEFIQLMLQIVHGTFILLNEFQIHQLLPLAKRFKIYTVTRKCELRMIQILRETEPIGRSGRFWEFLWLARCYDLPHLSCATMKLITNLKEMKELGYGMNLERMSGEAMKAVASKIFSFA
ncbi:hypothetical protein L5515_015284 [Caenorhabditis briggsae]|uniref:BTB domain-containing protein n=1 Tax=Caenorhabditis briggsae TaxID=6238 RepID=A0AAE9EBG0_CAEBR|nr:hypothetical protein L5515_015284 [Caenorhabditis briggsae]